MRFNLKVKYTEFFYFMALFLFGFANTVISNSYLFGKSGSKFEVANYVSYMAAVLFFISFCCGQMKLITIVKNGFLCFVAFFVSLNTSSIGFGVSILAIIAAVNIDFRKIVKWCICINIFYLFIVIAPSLIGLIPNETYIHDGKIAYSLGFAYYSNVSYIVLMIMVMGHYLTKTKKTENRLLLWGIPAQFIVYKVSTVKLVFYVYLLFVAAVFISRITVRKANKLRNLISAGMFPIAMLITIVSSLFVHSMPFLSRLDELLSARLSMNYIGFLRYGLKLFGQKIETSTEWLDINYINHYFYIDSGYIYALLGYGIIITLIVILAYSMLSYNASSNCNGKLLVWCFVVCVFCVINNILVNILINPLPILAVKMLINHRKKRTKKKRSLSHEF